MHTFNLMDAKVVLVQFPTSPDKDYAYFVPEGDDPRVGDVVLTSTSWDTHGGEAALGRALNHLSLAMTLNAALVHGPARR